MESKVNCLPVYILIDTSGSMAPVEDVLNQAIEELYDELIMSPMVSDFAQVSIISFDTDSRVVLQMTDLHAMDALPRLGCGGVTNFGKALRLLRQQIDTDVPALKSAGRHVLRPVIFLLTDGKPTDENGHLSDGWRPDFAALTDPTWQRHPNLVPFGYGDATASMLTEVATLNGAAFLAKDGGTRTALQQVIPTLLRTLVASARDNELRIPAEVDGFIRVSPEVVE